jgi:hypothetical protein
MVPRHPLASLSLALTTAVLCASCSTSMAPGASRPRATKTLVAAMTPTYIGGRGMLYRIDSRYRAEVLRTLQLPGNRYEMSNISVSAGDNPVTCGMFTEDTGDRPEHDLVACYQPGSSTPVVLATNEPSKNVFASAVVSADGNSVAWIDTKVVDHDKGSYQARISVVDWVGGKAGSPRTFVPDPTDETSYQWPGLSKWYSGSNNVSQSLRGWADPNTLALTLTLVPGEGGPPTTTRYVTLDAETAQRGYLEAGQTTPPTGYTPPASPVVPKPRNRTYTELLGMSGGSHGIVYVMRESTSAADEETDPTVATTFYVRFAGDKAGHQIRGVAFDESAQLAVDQS